MIIWGKKMKVCFFDIDGTLAIDLDVPASAALAIEKFRAQGNLVFICTGRPLPYVKQYFRQYADGFICFNGRYAVLNDRVLYDVPLKKEEVNKIVKILDSCKAGYGFSNNDSISNSLIGGYIHGTYNPFEYKDVPVYNFGVFFEDKAHFHRIEEALKEIVILNPHGDAPHADATILGSDKGTAIRAVCEQLNIPKEDSFAFGDGANDVCMMEAVGHGIAMGNALDVLKEKASYITDPIDQDGVWNAMVHFDLMKESMPLNA